AEQKKANDRLAVSLVRERASNNALAAANQELTRSRAAVQFRYDQAVEAVKTFHSSVSGEALLGQDQFKELRDRLLQSEADAYKKLGAPLNDKADRPSHPAASGPSRSPG